MKEPCRHKGKEIKSYKLDYNIFTKTPLPYTSPNKYLGAKPLLHMGKEIYL